jgi:cell division protein FtsQ
LKQQRTARRRRGPTAAQRIRPFWLLVIVLALGLTALGIAFQQWPALHPHAIEVTGTNVVSKDEVLAKAAVDGESNLWLQDTAAMSRRIETIPYVKTADVTRVPPATLRIAVTERTPYAIVVSGPYRSLVDDELRVLSGAVPGRGKLPEFRVQGAGAAPGAFLAEAGAVGFLADAKALTAAGVDAAVYDRDRFGDLVVTLGNGVRVELGDESDVAKKAVLIGPILAQTAAHGRQLASIDLRAPSTPVVTYKK